MSEENKLEILNIIYEVFDELDKPDREYRNTLKSGDYSCTPSERAQVYSDILRMLKNKINLQEQLVYTEN